MNEGVGHSRSRSEKLFAELNTDNGILSGYDCISERYNVLEGQFHTACNPPDP